MCVLGGGGGVCGWAKQPPGLYLLNQGFSEGASSFSALFPACPSRALQKPILAGVIDGLSELSCKNASLPSVTFCDF